jgi:fructose-bisphosphate aldolase, class I
MRITSKVKNILSHYTHENVGIRMNLARILMEGALGGTGKLLMLPVDQGFEHGPARSFAKNPLGYDPCYHLQLAIDAKLSAFAAPLGMLEQSISEHFGIIPTILKMNSGNSLMNAGSAPYQAVTATVKDALRLGCSAIGFTLYPASDKNNEMMGQLKELADEAKSYGLAVVVWSYPRGGNLSKTGETGIDIIAYAAHMAALMGAHIIKVKPPTDFLELEAAKKVYNDQKIPIKTLEQRVRHVVQSCFEGKRMVVFSGGEAKDEKGILAEVSAIRDGGGTGSIMGRNSFQRPYNEALDLLDKIIKCYKGK